MLNGSPLESEQARSAALARIQQIPPERRWLRPLTAAIPAASKWMSVIYSLSDQAFAVGAPFLANVALARTQTKEEFGIFVLSYSAYAFLYGLYNAAVLEPYTVYGSGRHRSRFPAYLRLMLRSNAVLGLVLTILLLSACLVLRWADPQAVPRPLAGLGLTVGILLSGTFLRRTFYVQRQPIFAAGASMVCFVAVACELWLAVRSHVLDSFSVYLILAFGWIAAGAVFGRNLALGNPGNSFLKHEPDYWREHWKYSQWALATAFVFQFTTQGYYWLVAAFLSVTDVAELRATYLLVAPVEQVSIAVSLIVLPALATHFAAARLEDLLSLWKRNALFVVCATGSFAIAVRVAGKLAMHVLYAGKFDGAAPLLYMLAVFPTLTGLAGTLVNALNAVEKPRLVFHACVWSSSATFLLGIPLVLRMGLRGAVFGMLLSGGAYVAALSGGFLLHVYKPARIAILSSVPVSSGIAEE